MMMSFLTKEEALAEHTNRTWHEGFWWGFTFALFLMFVTIVVRWLGFGGGS